MDWMSFALGFFVNFAVIGVVAVIVAAKTAGKKYQMPRRRKRIVVALGLVLAVFAGHLALRELFRQSVLQDGEDAQDVFGS